VRDAPKGDYILPFEDDSGQFHVPIRCEEEALGLGGDLCAKCLVRQVRTERKLEEIGSKTTIGGMLPSYLHGKITDPIPYWSRIYDGGWFRLKVAGGCRVSEAVMAKARKAAAAAYEGVEGAGTAEPSEVPVVKRGRKPGAGAAKKKEEVVAEEVVEPVEVKPPPVESPKPKKKGKTLAEKRGEIKAAAQPSILSFINAAEQIKDEVPAFNLDAMEPVAVPVVAAAAAPKPAPAAKPKKTPAKKAGAAAAPTPVENQIPGPKARVDVGTRADPVDDVQTIHVVAKTLGGRQVYYEPKKDKVYDLKFKYLGRWDSKKGAIVAFADSDAEP
jgi:hypothetical protein